MFSEGRGVDESGREAADDTSDTPLSAAAWSGLTSLAAALGEPVERVAAAVFVALFAGDEGLGADGAATLPGWKALEGRTLADLTRALGDGAIERVATSAVTLELGTRSLRGSSRLLHLVARRIEVMAGAGARDPRTPVLALPSLSEEEAAEIASRAEGPPRSIPEGTPADDVRRHAARSPAAPALSDAWRSLDYAALDAEVDRVAATLHARGVTPGARVGVILARSAASVVLMLAAFRIGAVYVPIDPAYPPDRVARVLADADCAVVVHDEHGAARLGALAVPRLDIRDAAGGAMAPLPVPPAPLAYIIYTSGSTGTPKGVEVAHAAFRNTIAAKVAMLAVTPADRFVAVMSTAFDASIFEFCMPLFAGASLHVAPAETVADPDALAKLVDEAGATAMGATPPTWRALLESGWKPRRRLRVMVGGEALPAELATRLAVHFRTFNMYGLTETAITSTAFEIDGRPLGTTCPIGLPLPNTVVRVVDPYGRLVPLGGVGELFIGGVGLAEGYRGRPELTRERFVPDPIGRHPGRFFRTGDRVRLREDGLLEFLGRLDTQVKVRGARVELGEVEASLEAHPAVSGAAVLCEGAVGEEELVAFVTTRAELTPEALRRAIRQALPEHAVPTEIVMVPALPLTANGKIDRRALARLPRERARGKDARAAAHAPDESLGVVVEELAMLVGAPSIDPSASLGDLGVSSVARVRLKKALEARGLGISYVALMGDATLRSIARAVSVAPPRPPSPAREGAERALDNQRFPLMVHLANAGRGAWNCQIACTIEGELHLDLLEEAWQALVDRHDTLRLSFPWRGLSHPAATIAAIVTVAVERIAIDATGRHAADAVVALQEREVATQFELERAPLFRVAVARLAPTTHELVWTYFSGLFDGWSSAIVLRELFAVYDARVAGRPHGLPPAASFLEHLARHNARSWEEASSFFARDLAGFTPPPLLAGAPGGTDEERDVDRLAPDVRDLFVAMRERPFWVERPGHLSVPFPAATRARVAAVASASGIGMASILAAAWSVVLMREYERADVLVGMVVANRPDFEHAIGKYTSLLPFRVRIANGSMTIAAWLHAVQDHVSQVHEHEGTPVRTWVRNVVSEPWHMPFESTFTLVNYAGEPPRARTSGLKVARTRQVEGGIPPVFGMVVIPGDPGVLRLEHNTRCAVDPERAARMLATFAELVDRFAEGNLDAPVATLLETALGGARFGVPIEVL